MTPISDHETAERLRRRPWLATPLRPEISFSVEVFPPASRPAWDQLAGCAERLDDLAPAFMSVTSGAGGTSRGRTHQAVATLGAAFDSPIAAHVTGAGMTLREVNEVLDGYRAIGCARIVALRGDDRAGVDPGAGDIDSAEDLVRAIRLRPDGDDFDISVAGYPEVHPRAATATADLASLKAKVDAGADRIITQYCFDTAAVVRFAEQARAAGIAVPISVGIMPISHYERVVRFSERCGAGVPSWLRDLFGELDEAPEIRRMVAATVAAEQCRAVIEHGLTDLHFYTLNQAELTLAALRTVGVRAPEKATERAVRAS